MNFSRCCGHPRLIALLFVMAAIVFEARAAEFDPASMRVVVSVRKFTPDDKRSYHHLFLYSGDGKLVRRLTNVEGSHDVNPVFSPDGKQLVFQRSSPGVKDGSADGWYRIEDLEKPAAVKLAGNDAVPEWYRIGATKVHRSLEVTGSHLVRREGETLTEEFEPEDGKQILEEHVNWSSERNLKPDGQRPGPEETPVTVWLRDTATSASQRLAGFPGFEPMQYIQIEDNPFLIRPPLRAAILDSHLNSTDGTRKFAIDLNRRSLHLLAPNGGEIFPVGGDQLPNFFFICQERYQPLGNGHTTVNCEYLDLWDADFKRTRFAPPISDFGGAAVWIPGQPPMAIPIPYAPDK